MHCSVLSIVEVILGNQENSVMKVTTGTFSTFHARLQITCREPKVFIFPIRHTKLYHSFKSFVYYQLNGPPSDPFFGYTLNTAPDFFSTPLNLSNLHDTQRRQVLDKA